MSALTHFSLFSGIGGIDLAAEAAGFTTVCQCEWADFPMEVLKKHWPQVPKFRDITTVTKEAFFEKTGRETTTLISGGFPCQPFSSAGKQRGFEDERYLWPEMLRVIRELHPSWVLGENVAGFIHLGLDKTVFDLEQAGYAVRVFVLPAVAVGAWHERKRTFIIGHTASHAPCQRHGGCGEDCRCADDPDRELPKIQPQRNRMDGAAVMGGLQTAGQPAGGCETESRLGGMADGIPPEMDGHSMWAKEPAQIPYLISDPPANVAKRLKTLGNAVVPPQVYPILRYIAEIETGRCRNRQQGGDRISSYKLFWCSRHKSIRFLRGCLRRKYVFYGNVLLYRYKSNAEYRACYRPAVLLLAAFDIYDHSCVTRNITAIQAVRGSCSGWLFNSFLAEQNIIRCMCSCFNVLESTSGKSAAGF